MLKSIQRCKDHLAALVDTKNQEEYMDTLMNIIINMKYMVERCIKEKTITEDVLLGCHQITTCLRFIGQKPSDSVELFQYFEPRIRFCLSELLRKDEPMTSRVPESVLTTMDVAIDLLENRDLDTFESLIDVVDHIDRLLSQVLLFRTVILPEDHQKVLDMCRCVLGKKLELKQAVDTPVDMQQILINDLKLSVLELEQLLNNCLLRLFVSVMVELGDDDVDPFAEATFDETGFDLLMDRLIQLGIIAIGFTDSGSVKLNLRSAVASLESLDLHLVPVLLRCRQQKRAAGCTLRQTLLQHWREETAKLSVNIHKIIDTKAFASCLIEWISEQLNRNEVVLQAELNEEADRKSCLDGLDGIRKMFHVFHQHLCLNGIGEAAAVETVLADKDLLLQDHRKDLKIMLNECKAVLKYANQVEASRIFKRFRLLLHILEKVHRDLPLDCDNDEAAGVENLTGACTRIGATQAAAGEVKGSLVESGEQPQHVPTLASEEGPCVAAVEQRVFEEESTKFFSSFGISMAEPSRLFYRGHRARRFCNDVGPLMMMANPSMIPQLSTLLRNSQRHRKRPRLFRETTLGKVEGTGNGRRTNRVAFLSGSNVHQQSLQLNITEILEQLATASETFIE